MMLGNKKAIMPVCLQLAKNWQLYGSFLLKIKIYWLELQLSDYNCSISVATEQQFVALYKVLRVIL